MTDYRITILGNSPTGKPTEEIRDMVAKLKAAGHTITDCIVEGHERTDIAAEHRAAEQAAAEAAANAKAEAEKVARQDPPPPNPPNVE